MELLSWSRFTGEGEGEVGHAVNYSPSLSQCPPGEIRHGQPTFSVGQRPRADIGHGRVMLVCFSSRVYLLCGSVAVRRT
jgi:hypothetical protein